MSGPLSDYLNSGSSDIFNGARCETYRWSQSHSDLEIRVELERPITHEDIEVEVTSSHLRISRINHLDTIDKFLAGETETQILVEGDLEDHVDVESAYWVLDMEQRPCLIVYIDKVVGKWWNGLLKNEISTQKGPTQHIIDIEDLPEDSRMTIDKLVYEQRAKFDLNDNEDFSLV